MFAVSNFSYLCPYSRRRTAKPDWLRVTAADNFSSHRVFTSCCFSRTRFARGWSGRFLGSTQRRQRSRSQCVYWRLQLRTRNRIFDERRARAPQNEIVHHRAGRERMGDELTERTTREREKESDGGCGGGDLVDDGARNWSRE